MPVPVKRTYDSTRRHALAQATRQHVIETATPLFIDQGYEATSVRQLAAAAGVSLQTLYNAFGSKFGIFSALMDVIIVGDHEAVPLSGRPEIRALEATDDASAMVEALVRATTPVLGRLSIIYPTLRAAAASDPQVAEAHQRFTHDARYADLRPFGRRLADLGALPAHLTPEQATDILWAVLSPDVYDLLTAHRGWSADDFQSWATRTLIATLLQPWQ
jgi:AcrR family transcriptional regulator